MVLAEGVASEYQEFDSPEGCFYSSGQAEIVESMFISANEPDWEIIKVVPEDQTDVEESLRALEEPEGIKLDDFKRELGLQ